MDDEAGFEGAETVRRGALVVFVFAAVVLAAGAFVAGLALGRDWSLLSFKVSLRGAA